MAMVDRDLSAVLFADVATLPEFAKAIGRSERQVRRFIKDGLPSVKRGNIHVIVIDAGKAWLRGEEPAPRRGRPKNAARAA